jgi:chromate transporter
VVSSETLERPSEIVVNPAMGGARRYSLWSLISYALRLGTFGFGGPVALVGYMHRDLVERNGWFSEAEYKEGLTLAQLMPGPLAAQLAIYLGFVHYGIIGATSVGITFVLPSFLMVVALGWAYRHFGGLAWMQAVFYGVGAAVIGIIAHSAYKLTKKTIGRQWLLWAIFVTTAAITAVMETELVWVVLAGGVLFWLVKTPPKLRRVRHVTASVMLLPISDALPAAASIDPKLLGQLFLYFAKAGAFVFGSGLAIVPFLYGGVVKDHHWLTERQFVDAVAVAMITPGPVVITVGFIGFLVAGLGGAVVAALGTFFPCYFFTIVPAPYFRRHGKRPGIVAFVDGVTAGAVGAITGAVVVLGRRSIIDVPTAILALAALLILWRAKKAPEPFIVLAAALIGLVVYPLVRH